MTFIERFYHRTSALLWAMVVFSIVSTPATASATTTTPLMRVFAFLIMGLLWYAIYGAVAWAFSIVRRVARA